MKVYAMKANSTHITVGFWRRHQTKRR